MHSQYLRMEEGRRQTARWRLRQITEHVRTGKLLDIGCSAGFFLDEARALGFETVGTEIREIAVHHAKQILNLTVYDEADLTAIDFGTRFDVVTLYNVLEHIPVPSSFLTHISEHLLSDGGIAVIEVPNIFSIQSIILGTRGTHLQLGHYSYYSPKTFRLLAAKAGLEIIAFRYGMRVYPLEYALQTYLNRYKKVQLFGSRVLRALALDDKVFQAGFREFLFFVCGKR
jgi:2-polyprenyl-3-methyl-5-hydroxy-6-metoxy-1,4-benzoquinol methylase